MIADAKDARTQLKHLQVMINQTRQLSEKLPTLASRRAAAENLSALKWAVDELGPLVKRREAKERP